MGKWHIYLNFLEKEAHILIIILASNATDKNMEKQMY